MNRALLSEKLTKPEYKKFAEKWWLEIDPFLLRWFLKPGATENLLVLSATLPETNSKRT